VILSAAYIATQSVYLKICLSNSLKASKIRIERDSTNILETTLYLGDTLIVDDSLQAGKTYFYRGYLLEKDKIVSSSEILPVTTMDTTYHEIYAWEIDTLGISGEIRDVWIVDENDIWVVGNIETDSGQYNAAHWDGSKWEMLGIYSNTLDLLSIYYFSDDDIWVTDFGFPIHWDGNGWTLYHLQNMGMAGVSAGNAIWASSTNNIYFVGYQDSIVHYDGSTFRKIGSGTELNISDVYGFDDGTIFMQASSLSELTSNLIQVSGQDVRSVYSDDTYRNDIWGASPNYLWSVGEGIFRYNSQNQQMIEYAWPVGTPKWMLEVIDGNAVNNVFTGGHNSLVMHYNGQSWKHYSELLGYGIVTGIDVYQNMVAIVSVDGSNTYIIRGK